MTNSNMKSKNYSTKRRFFRIDMTDVDKKYQLQLQIIFTFKIGRYRFNIQKEELIVKRRNGVTISTATWKMRRDK